MITPQKLAELYEIYRNHPTVVTDSRNILPDSLFFALRGASFDGNRFAAESLTKGAVIAIVDDPAAIPALEGEELTHQEAVAKGYFLVDDVLDVMQRLASLHRTTLGIPILAITGTNGKTTTKELMAAVLSEKFNLYATQGNLNNHIGVPLTLLAMKPGIDFGIVEMGASAQREIALLCGMAKPDYGIITNVGRAHLEGFGGEEGVKIAKGELYDYLASTGGMAFVRMEDEKLTAMASQRAGMKTTFYSTSSAEGYESNLAGDYNTYNIAAAVAVGLFFDIPEEALKKAVKNYSPNANRSQIIDTGRNRVIADCYNANPSSMKAALQWFGNYVPEEGIPDKTVILGDMFELGEWSAQEHKDVLQAAMESSPRQLILLGKEFSKAASVMMEKVPDGMSVSYYADADEFISCIGSKLIAIYNSVVLIKGSRGMALERIFVHL